MRTQTNDWLHVTRSLTSDDLAKFWRQVERVADCWIWRGSLVDGRPQAHLQRRPRRIRVRANVAAWLLEGREFTKQFLIPTCGEDLCIRPEHQQEAHVGDLPHNSDDARSAEFWARVAKGDSE
jgi:hypothetical protein